MGPQGWAQRRKRASSPKRWPPPPPPPQSRMRACRSALRLGSPAPARGGSRRHHRIPKLAHNVASSRCHPPALQTSCAAFCGAPLRSRPTGCLRLTSTRAMSSSTSTLASSRSSSSLCWASLRTTNRSRDPSRILVRAATTSSCHPSSLQGTSSMSSLLERRSRPSDWLRGRGTACRARQRVLCRAPRGRVAGTRPDAPCRATVATAWAAALRLAHASTRRPAASSTSRTKHKEDSWSVRLCLIPSESARWPRRIPPRPRTPGSS
mmetsp:Transcript_550/g.1828  ORF Transcript_550/g.1828 Transcript_550/m.1828 type:complete len:265 (-) Transcript_550:3123-3917(-)